MEKFITIKGQEMGTNCYCLEKNGKVICVDFVPELTTWLAENDYTLTDLLLTHIHYDHMAGLPIWQQEHDFTLHLSQSANDSINDPHANLLIMFPGEQWKNIPKIKLDHANIVGTGSVIKWQNLSIDVLESPGHTESCIMFIIHQLQSVLSGDTLFQGSVGRTDFPGGDFPTLRASIDHLFNQVNNEYSVLPGHGPSTTIENEKRDNPFLK